jgi:integrase
MKRRLSDRGLMALKPGAGTIMDSDVAGFGVRVSDRGKRTFILISRYGTNNPTRRALGTYPEMGLAQARDKAREWRSLIAQGRDPKIEQERLKREEQRKQANSFAAVAEDFFAHIKRQKQRRAADVERAVRREFVGRWGDRPISEIDRFDVQAVIDATVKRGKESMAHLLLAYVRRLFNFAIAREYGIDRSPCDRMKPKDVIGEKEVRDRVLTDDELRALWRAAARNGYPYGSFVQVLLLTGQRRAEVAEMTWRELDLYKREWTLPRERMKAKVAHVVPLTSDVVTILEGLPRFQRGDYVFSHTFGASPISVSSKAKKLLDRQMNVELGRTVEFRLHDCRRTLRTGLSRLRVRTEVAEAVIGHGKRGLLRVYDQHRYLDEMREALELWAKCVRDIIEPSPANVIPIRA